MGKIKGKYGLLIDTTKCVGCMQCVAGCKKANNLPEEEDPTKLSAETFTIVEDHDGVYRRKFCFHCQDPACASVCPAKALQKTSDGPVVYDPKKCIGCRYCMTACPHAIPRYDWENTVPTVRKCIMCSQRVADGQQTACAEACKFGATNFGLYDDMLNEARNRVAKDPENYINHIYGEHEVGGSQVMYIASKPFEELGFNTKVSEQALPDITRNALSMFPNVLSVGGVMLMGTWWIINRRMTVAQEKAIVAKLDAEDKEVKR